MNLKNCTKVLWLPIDCDSLPSDGETTLIRTHRNSAVFVISLKKLQHPDKSKISNLIEIPTKHSTYVYLEFEGPMRIYETERSRF